MAHLRRGILGPVQGGIDGMIGRVIWDKAVIQSKGQTGQNSQRLGTTEAQDKMFWLRWYTTQIPDLIWNYFMAPSKKTWTPRNQWIKSNFDFVGIEGDFFFNPKGYSLGNKQPLLSIELDYWNHSRNPVMKFNLDVPNANTLVDPYLVGLVYNVTQKKWYPNELTQPPPYDPIGLNLIDTRDNDVIWVICWFCAYPNKSGKLSSPAVMLEFICIPEF